MTQLGFNDNGINRNLEVQLVNSSVDILPTLRIALLGIHTCAWFENFNFSLFSKFSCYK